MLLQCFLQKKKVNRGKKAQAALVHCSKKADILYKRVPTRSKNPAYKKPEQQWEDEKGGGFGRL